MALVILADFQNLPAEPTLRWLELRDLLERRLGELLSEHSPGVNDSDLLEYCTILSEAANTLNIEELQRPSYDLIRAEFEKFRAEATALATRLSIDPNPASHRNSITLERITKKNIIKEIETLRSLISESDLPNRQRERLERKLGELHSLVVSPQFDIVKALFALTVIGSITAQSTAFLADAPAAIGTITSLIGLEKEAEKEDIKFLQIPNKPVSIPDFRNETNNADEIPF